MEAILMHGTVLHHVEDLVTAKEDFTTLMSPMRFIA